MAKWKRVTRILIDINMDRGSPLPLLPGQPSPRRRRPLRFITSLKHQASLHGRGAPSRVDLAGFRNLIQRGDRWKGQFRSFHWAATILLPN
jgi:hypothetical protein